jgi:hypothetical protein
VLIGPFPYVPIGNTRHPLLVWPILFGRTGSGRKGEAGETASVFLTRAAGDAGKVTVSGLSSGEGLIERIRDPKDEDDPGGTDDKRLLVVEPEFATVMSRAKREGSTLAAVLRQAWDGRALTVLNRTALAASASHVAIVGHVTPKEFKARLADSEMAGGTYNRFLPVYVERSKKLPIPDGIGEASLAALSSRLGAGIFAARQIGRVHLDQGATALWQNDLYDELTASDDEDEPWTEFTRRAAPYCRRIAALHAVLDGRELVNAGDLAAAGALVRYSVASARYVLGPRRDPRYDRIVRAVDGAAARGLTRTQISALFSRHLDKKLLDELLAALLDTGEYENVPMPTGGRPKEVYRRCAKKAK